MTFIRNFCEEGSMRQLQVQRSLAFGGVSGVLTFFMLLATELVQQQQEDIQQARVSCAWCRGLYSSISAPSFSRSGRLPTSSIMYAPTSIQMRLGFNIFGGLQVAKPPPIRLQAINLPTDVTNKSRVSAEYAQAWPRDFVSSVGGLLAGRSCQQLRCHSSVCTHTSVVPL